MSLRPYLGANVTPLSVEEMHHRGLLQEGETLLALFDGTLLDENNRRVGGLALSDFLALTNRRVIFWARGFFNDTVDGFPWQDVDVAEYATWDPFHGRIRFALRIPAAAPRQRRIAVKGSGDQGPGSGERVFVNTLDYMPAEDVPMLAKMIGWVADRVIAEIPGEELIAAFAVEFPAIERLIQPTLPFLQPSFPAPEPEPPPPPPAPTSKWRWWPFGRSEEVSVPEPGTSVGLVSAYERGRTRQDGAYQMTTIDSGSGAAPLISEQPSMYDISRAVRLMLEGPRRLKGTMGRANQMMSGAGELLTSVQDPSVRRVALKRLRQVVTMQEQMRGPLAPVAPLARAVIAFTEDPNEAAEEAPSARRIQVRASVRRRDAPAEHANGQTGARRIEPEIAETTGPVVRSSAAVRRQINVRREDAADQPAQMNAEAEPAAETPAMPMVRTSATVRRQINMRRTDAADQPAAGEREEANEAAHNAVPTRREINLRRVETVNGNGNGNGNGVHHTVEAAEAAEVGAPEPPRIAVRRIVVGKSEGEE